MKKRSSIIVAIMFAMSSTIFISNANADVVKNGLKCQKVGQIAKVGSKSYKCTNFYGTLMWADKNWAPINSSPYTYKASFDLLLSFSDSRLWGMNYEYVFDGSYAYRPWALDWCKTYFVTPSVFGQYYSYTAKSINQAVVGCADAVMRRNG